jgi:hypothetical protein
MRQPRAPSRPPPEPAGGDAVITGQLDPLGVHHDHAQVVGSVVQQQAADEGIHTHRLTGAGRPGDQQVRHSSQVGGDGVAGHVLSHPKRSGDFKRWKGLAFEDIAQGHHGNIIVGDFDAYITFARHWGFHTDAPGSQGQSQVICQGGDLTHAHARASLAALDESQALLRTG